jgi:succinate dehydrogenase flavin-adding protein (antitoxin of CptAB toxin-antitoxin module)
VNAWTTWKTRTALFRCHSIMNCVDVCPKGPEPTRAIGRIKELLVRRRSSHLASVSELDRIRWHCRRGLLESGPGSRALLERDSARCRGRAGSLQAIAAYPDNDLWDLDRRPPEPSRASRWGSIRLLGRLRGAGCAPHKSPAENELDLLYTDSSCLHPLIPPEHAMDRPDIR